MESFKFGHASAMQWREAAQACLNQMGDLTNYAPNLGFLYTTDLFAANVPDILDYFKQNTNVQHWVGTVGIGICSHAKEYFDVPAIAVMLGSFEEEYFSVFTTISDNFDTFSRTHQSWCNNKLPMFAIVHGDPRHKHIAKLVFQMSERLGEGFLVGGLTSSRHQYLQIADTIVEGGLSGVLFSSAVSVSTRLSQGCSAIGPRHQITESSNNIIIKIDDRPALDVFKEDIGKDLAKDLEKVAGYIFAALPIRGSDMGDYTVRNIIGIDPEHKFLAIGETVNPGMSVMFTRRDAKIARQEFIKVLEKLKASLKGSKPKGGLYHSCLGRGENLFGKDSQEVKVIQSVLGDFPLVGFFANGEIYYQRLYGYTGILTLFL
ncbi:MAG: histidine kinase [Candidatus Parabeggiatoa sp. nov. 2]|nr:MAG: histidine kinase [Beggiatoa sp. 4572_84]RKZ60835.1 MAG: histidine kinase [Gammaproteobacteria bacterium]